MSRGPTETRRRLYVPADALAAFLKAEAAGGVVLVVAAAAAIVWANSPAADTYSGFWAWELTIGAGAFSLTQDLQHWVNDALMTLFFFVVGLEIKRELVTGELQRPRAAALPVLGAFGGALLPAAIFLLVVGSGEGAEGWAVPMATDIAFAVGVLALLGDRVGASVKLFLLTVAIVDDILAISVIAIFYSKGIAALWLLAAIAGLAAIVAFQRLRVVRIWPYIPLGLFVWFATFESGIHATIAGVAIGLLTPARPLNGRHILEELEHRLHPVTSFLIVPLFALANAGLTLGASELNAAATSSLTWAIVAGLVVGKLLGIVGATLIGLRLRLGDLPPGLGTRQLWGVAALGGIGFTVSLFIAQLAFESSQLVDNAKVGIFAGSLISAIIGVFLLARPATSATPELLDEPAADGSRKL